MSVCLFDGETALPCLTQAKFTKMRSGGLGRGSLLHVIVSTPHICEEKSKYGPWDMWGSQWGYQFFHWNKEVINANKNTSAKARGTIITRVPVLHHSSTLRYFTASPDTPGAHGVGTTSRYLKIGVKIAPLSV